MPSIDLSILNQRQTPAFFADTLANRPAPSYVGRIFISTDTLDLYRDTGSAWLLLSPSSTGTITGLGAAGQVTIFSGASSITGTNNLFWDTTNLRLGINTNTPGASLDVHSAVNSIAQFNQTIATNDTRIAFQNSGVAKWRIGSFYNLGSNDYAVNDATLNINRFTIKSSSGQTFVGDETTSSGLFVVNNSSADAHLVVLGATAPSLRVRNAGVGASLQFGLGLATTTNNFIQGATGGEFCIFNDSLTAQPILFGIKDAGLGNTQEAARISAARNLLVGTTTDGGQRLQISGSARATSYYLDGMTAGSGALYYSSSRLTLANYNASGYLSFEVNGGNTSLTLNSDLSATFNSNVSSSTIISSRTSVPNAGTNNNPYFEDAFNLGQSNNLSKIQYGNSFVDNNGTWIRFVVNSSTGQNTPINALTLRYDAAATFINTINNNLTGHSTIGLYLNSNQPSGINWYDADDVEQYSIGIIANSGAGYWGLWSSTSGTAIDRSTATPKFAVKNNGNFLIGTTTDAGQKLQVNGTSTAKQYSPYTSNTIAIPSNTTNYTIISYAFNGIIVIRDVSFGGSAVFLLDANNGAISISSNLGYTLTFTYSAGIWLVQKNTGGATTIYFNLISGV